MILTEQQAKQYLYNAGFRRTHLTAAVKIGVCESGLNTNAHNTSGEDSRGFMQINVAPNANPQYINENLFNPQVNANVAFAIYKNRGYNFYDWTCARNLGLVYPPQIDFIAPLALASVGIILYFYL